MKTSKLLASSLIALASVAATSAFADSYDRNYPVVVAAPGSTGLTRAQVQAELAQARQDGSLAAYNDDQNYPVIAPVGTPKTRAEVQAELVQAIKDGSIPVVRS
ncbi:protein of unknown function [Rhodoferax sp. OV413]|uniref:DUF4148 domain-containing protein n=1 Tax=Rhodoferax sp. OV413 TaxID=1855285 RepID=UPI0008892C12|nr:DUF4148 domain-containing protein [Rhodoferax sp. OV413]SDP89632.1 protein of unknown function [Rhodoferax sp. OV413]